ncbi:MAG: hypothetical protein V4671_32870 [Armatimonadota bacterium]
MQKELIVHLRIMTIGLLIGSLWSGVVWGQFAMVTAGAPFPTEWFGIIAGWALSAPLVMSLMIAAIPMNFRHKAESITALLTPVILFSLYQLFRTWLS